MARGANGRAPARARRDPAAVGPGEGTDAAGHVLLGSSCRPGMSWVPGPAARVREIGGESQDGALGRVRQVVDLNGPGLPSH